MKKTILSILILGTLLSASAQVPSYVPKDSLKGWWPFSGNANDQSGTGNTGTVTGATLVIDRKNNANKAYSFSSSTTSKIELKSTPTTISNSFTMSIWVKPNRTINLISESSACPGTASVPMANANQNWAYAPTSAKIGVGISIGTNAVLVAEHATNLLICRMGYTTTINDFVHVVLTYANDSTKLYINGKLVRSRPTLCTTVHNIIEPHQLGTALYSPNFSGIIDDFGIWNRALTYNEIQSLTLSINPSTYTSTLIAQDTIKACGDSVLLSATSGMKSYLWSNGKTTSSIYAKKTGMYKVTVTNSNAPLDSLYDNIFVSILKAKIIQNDTSICQGARVTLNVEQNSSSHSIGSIGPAGGYIFYDKGNYTNGWRYLEVARNDISIGTSWGCAGTTIASLGTATGTGQSNTSKISSSCATSGIAAKLCDQAIINGYSDWFLPSKDEFNLIYQNIHKIGLGNFASNTGSNSSVQSYNRYWTSSQVSPYGWAQDFTPYYQQIQSKSDDSRVRPIRAFANNIKYLWSTGDTISAITVSPTQSNKYWVKVGNGISTCTDTIATTVINTSFNFEPSNQSSSINGQIQFNSLSMDTTSSYQWQSKQANLSWGDIPPSSFYTDVTSKKLTVNNIQINNHKQLFRVIATKNTCKDTSAIAMLTVNDTCITNVYDTIAVQDTLIINAKLTGTNPLKTNLIKVYPNPAKDYLVIDFGNYASMAGYEINILDVTGKSVYSSAINKASETIDLNTWTGKGVYFIKIYDKQSQQIENRKIVIQ